MRFYFYGEECPHCHVMMPFVDKLISEGVEIIKLETWHNQDNAKILQEKDNGKCGGVPFFYDDETAKFICGETSEEEVRKWAGK